MMHAETAPLLRKIEELRDEILELRREVSAKSGMRGSNRRQKQALV
jgi:hypothetical protein